MTSRGAAAEPRPLFVSSDAPPSEQTVVIELENIQKTYLLGVEGVPALRGVSLKISKGEFIIVYGTSGGGKTSLLNIIGTIDKPTKGHLTICNKRIGSRTTDTELANIRLKKMGFVFQTFNLLSTMSALENVEMPMVLLGTKSKLERRRRAKMLLEKVGMGPRLTHLPAQLSGGEQQRVTIARAIANEPEILLLDEPTGDLDTRNTLIVMDMLVRLNEEEKITLVMVTHDPALKNLAHRVVYMRDGRIHKIDKIHPSARNEMVHKLRSELSHSTGLGLSDRNSRFTSITEVRQPRFYSTHSAEGEDVGRYLVRNLPNMAGAPVVENGTNGTLAEDTDSSHPKGQHAPPSDDSGVASPNQPSFTAFSSPNVGGGGAASPQIVAADVEMQEMYSQVIIGVSEDHSQNQNHVQAQTPPQQHISIAIPEPTNTGVLQQA